MRDWRQIGVELGVCSLLNVVRGMRKKVDSRMLETIKPSKCGKMR
jgi:hypothetical protein